MSSVAALAAAILERYDRNEKLNLTSNSPLPRRHTTFSAVPFGKGFLSDGVKMLPKSYEVSVNRGKNVRLLTYELPIHFPPHLHECAKLFFVSGIYAINWNDVDRNRYYQMLVASQSEEHVDLSKYVTLNQREDQRAWLAAYRMMSIDGHDYDFETNLLSLDSYAFLFKNGNCTFWVLRQRLQTASGLYLERETQVIVDPKYGVPSLC